MFCIQRFFSGLDSSFLKLEHAKFEKIERNSMRAGWQRLCGEGESCTTYDSPFYFNAPFSPSPNRVFTGKVRGPLKALAPSGGAHISFDHKLTKFRDYRPGKQCWVCLLSSIGFIIRARLSEPATCQPREPATDGERQFELCTQTRGLRVI